MSMPPAKQHHWPPRATAGWPYPHTVHSPAGHVAVCGAAVTVLSPGAGKTTFLRALAAGEVKGMPPHAEVLHVEQEVVGDDTPVLQVRPRSHALSHATAVYREFIWHLESRWSLAVLACQCHRESPGQCKLLVPKCCTPRPLHACRLVSSSPRSAVPTPRAAPAEPRRPHGAGANMAKRGVHACRRC